jgi:predicted alpha/beta hydrolase family esterase
LKKLEIDFAIPDLRGGKYPHADEWLNVLHQEVLKSKKPLVLVGHSLGSRAVPLYIEKYSPKVKLVLLIAAFANKLENGLRKDGEAYPDFFVHKIDVNKVKDLAEEFVVMHSKDDDSIAYKQGVEIANDLQAELITYKDRGHFSKPENASYILNVLRKKLNF